CGTGCSRPGCLSAPRSRRPRDPLFGGTAWDEEEEEEEDDGPSLAQPPRDFGFGFIPSGSRGAFEELFRDVGELLGVFGGAWDGAPQRIGGEGKGLPLPGPPQPGPGEGSAGRPLRDSMLKHPDSPAPGASPGGPEDSLPSPLRPPAPPELWGCVPTLLSPSHVSPADLDSQVSSAGLGTILTPDEPKSRSYFQSVSVTKVTLPDGVSVPSLTGPRVTWGHRPQGEEQSGGISQGSLRAPNLSDPSSTLGSFLRRWFSSW
uniref:HCLS1 associated protein X-1 n=1 Tax=Otus sunia TaxID=257818 RepID=A0A8C8B2Y5_9STRI